MYYYAQSLEHVPSIIKEITSKHSCVTHPDRKQISGLEEQINRLASIYYGPP